MKIRWPGLALLLFSLSQWSQSVWANTGQLTDSWERPSPALRRFSSPLQWQLGRTQIETTNWLDPRLGQGQGWSATLWTPSFSQGNFEFEQIMLQGQVQRMNYDQYQVRQSDGRWVGLGQGQGEDEFFRMDLQLDWRWRERWSGRSALTQQLQSRDFDYSQIAQSLAYRFVSGQSLGVEVLYGRHQRPLDYYFDLEQLSYRQRPGHLLFRKGRLFWDAMVSDRSLLQNRVELGWQAATGERPLQMELRERLEWQATGTLFPYVQIWWQHELDPAEDRRRDGHGEIRQMGAESGVTWQVGDRIQLLTAYEFSRIEERNNLRGPVDQTIAIDRYITSGEAQLFGRWKIWWRASLEQNNRGDEILNLAGGPQWQLE